MPLGERRTCDEDEEEEEESRSGEGDGDEVALMEVYLMVEVSGKRRKERGQWNRD